MPGKYLWKMALDYFSFDTMVEKKSSRPKSYDQPFSISSVSRTKLAKKGLFLIWKFFFNTWNLWCRGSIGLCLGILGMLFLAADGSLRTLQVGPPFSVNRYCTVRGVGLWTNTVAARNQFPQSSIFIMKRKGEQAIVMCTTTSDDIKDSNNATYRVQ